MTMPNNASTSNTTNNTGTDSGLGQTLVSAALGAAIALAGCYYLISEQNKRIDQLQAETPPLAVLDIGAIVASYPKGISDQETDALMRRTNATIARFKEAGYVVLDAQQVIAAPNDVYLPVEAFIEALP